MHYSETSLKSKLLILILLTLIASFHCSTKDNSTNLNQSIHSENEYLAQTKPGLEPGVFALGAVTTDLSAHSYPVFSPDGKEVYWCAYAGSFRNQKIYFMIYENGQWSSPEIAPFSGEFRDDNPCFSLDGNKLYFHTSRPKEQGNQTGEMHCCFIEKSDTGWSEPKLLELAEDSDYLHAQISFSIIA